MPLRPEISGHSGDETHEALKSLGLVRKKLSRVELAEMLRESGGSDVIAAVLSSSAIPREASLER
jgi:hypothetical protein